MEKIILEAQKRVETGKKVKSLRNQGKLPAVIDGHELGSIPLTLDKKETVHTISNVSGSTLLTIQLEGQEYAALVREIQRDYLKNEVLHIDFLAVSLKEKLRTQVSITLVGDAPVLDEFEALIVAGVTHIEVECLPQDLPETIDIDLSGLTEIGSAIYVKDLSVPDNIEIITSPEELIAVASAVKEEVAEEAEEVLMAEVEEGAEPEVIEKGKTEEEGEAEG